MVKAVTKYESTDGSLHDSMQDARKHDMMYKQMSAIKKVFLNPRMGNSAGSMTIELMNNVNLVTEMRDACNGVLNYHRTYGKLRKDS